MKNIAVFASGSGTNAENIVKYFEDSDLARVAVIFCNRKNAGVMDRAHKLGVRSILLHQRWSLANGHVLSTS